MRWNGRQTALAGLLALTLLLGSLMATGSSAYAGGPAAVFYGYVVPDQSGVMPKRVRAISERGVVCGSADVAATASATAGFYALSVISGGTKDGCPTSGEPVYFALVYGLIDEGTFVGGPARFGFGEVTALHLLGATVGSVVALP